jgi:hypothetical protein
MEEILQTANSLLPMKWIMCGTIKNYNTSIINQLVMFKFRFLFSITVSLFLATSANSQVHRLLLRDEGISKLSFVDFDKPEKNWYVSVPAGRDIQLVGKGRVLIGTGTGYEERLIATGEKVAEITSFNGTIAARRLKNGNSLLAGLNWLDKKGIVFLETDDAGKIIQSINYPDYPYVRLVRETANGNFLITIDTAVFEGTPKGTIVWKARIVGPQHPHCWQALRLSNGNTVVSGGYAANMQVFDKTGKLIDTIGGPASVHPNFFGGYQILKNGNFLVTNWQGHGEGHGGSGVQLLEYSPKGKLIWSWNQDPTKYSSLQGVIALDGLDIDKLYIEDSNGNLSPVKPGKN